MSTHELWHSKFRLGLVFVIGFLPVLVLAAMYNSQPASASPLSDSSAEARLTTAPGSPASSSQLHSAQAPSVTLTLGPRRADPGDIFTLPFSVTTAPGFSGLRAYQFNFAFDPARIQVSSVTDGGFLQTAGGSCGVIQALPPVINNVLGTVSVPGWAILGCQGSAAAGSGVLANIGITVTNSAPDGRTPLTLTNVILADVNANGVPASFIQINSNYVQVGPEVAVSAPAGTIDWNAVFTAAINIDTGLASHGTQFALNFDPTRLRYEGISEGNFYKDWAVSNATDTVSVFPTTSRINISGTTPVMSVKLKGGSGGPTGTGTIANVRFRGIYPGQSPISLTNVLVEDSCSPTCQPLTMTVNGGQVQIGPAPVPTATLIVQTPSDVVIIGKEFTAAINISTAYASRAASFSLAFDPTRLHCQDASIGAFYSWFTSVNPVPVCDNTAGTLSVMGITVTGEGNHSQAGAGILANVRFQSVAAGTSPITLTSGTVSNNCSPLCQDLPVTLNNGSVTGVSTPTVSVNVPGGLMMGQVFTTLINIDTDLPTRGMQFGLQFDPAVIALDYTGPITNCSAFSEGNFYKDWALSNGASTFVYPPPTCSNITGTLSAVGIVVAGAPGQAPAGSGTIANVRFRALTVGTSPLTLTEVIVADQCAPGLCGPLPVVVNNGQAEIGAFLSPPEVSVSAPAGTIGWNEVFTVSVNISTAQVTRGTQFILNFDPTRIYYDRLGVTEGNFYKTWAQSNGASTVPVLPVSDSPNVTGMTPVMSVTLSGGTGGPTGTGTIANFRFRGISPGQSAISFTHVIVWDACSPTCQPLAATLAGAQIQTGPAPVPTATLTVISPPDKVAIGKEFTASINISTAYASRAGSFSLAFDPTRIHCESATPGQFYNWTIAIDPIPVCDNTAGTMSVMGITVTGSGNHSFAGTGIMADVRFKAVALGTSPITLTTGVVSDNCSPSCQDLPVTLSNSSATVAPTPTLSVNVPEGVTTGQVFTASINISSALISRGTVFGLQFDPAVIALDYTGNPINCNAAKEGSFYKNWTQSYPGASTLVFPQPTCNNISGTLSPMGISVFYNVYGVGPTGTGTVATVRFRALGAGTSPLTLTNVVVTDLCPNGTCGLPLPIAVNSGKVQVDAVMSTVAPAGTISWNEVFTASIDLSTPAASRGAQFVLNFDPTRIHFEGISEGSFYKDWAQSNGASTVTAFPASALTNISGTTAVMSVTLSGGSGGPTGTGTIANVRFRGIYPGQSPISLTNALVLNSCSPTCQPVTVTLASSQVQIGPAPVPTATLAVNVPAEPVVINKEFTASISISTVYASRAASFSLSFDPTRIRCQTVTEGTFFKNWAQSSGASTSVNPAPTCDNVAGTVSPLTITLSGAGNQGPTGMGNLANVRFQAVTTGTTPITLTTGVVANNCSPTCQTVPVVLSNGQVQIKQENAIYLPLIQR